MQISHLDYIDRVRRASTQSELQAIAEEFTSALGFQHIAYAVKSTGVRPRFRHFENFGGEWAKRYPQLAKPEVETTDSVLRHVRAGLPATAWSSHGEVAYTDVDIGREAKALLWAAGEHGLKGGLTVPIWAPGVQWAFTTFTTDHTTDLRDLLPTLPTAHFVSTYVHAASERLQGAETSLPILSARELEILRWASIGKTSWEIAQVLHISERTVNYHLQRTSAKLGVVGRQAAVALALANGLICL